MRAMGYGHRNGTDINPDFDPASYKPDSAPIVLYDEESKRKRLMKMETINVKVNADGSLQCLLSECNCNSRWDELELLIKHVVKEVMDLPRDQRHCPFCLSDVQDTLARHVRDHFNGEFECEVDGCNVVQRSAWMLRRHIEHAHPKPEEQRMYRCPECAKEFARKLHC